MSSKLSRRQWLKLGAAGAAGAMATPYFIPSGVLAADGKPGANDRVAIACIGVGGRATLLLEQLPDSGQLVALCDCNVPRAEKFKNDKKGDWPIYQNYHQVLERKDIDAVIIATQEWQRVTPSIHAVQAGKDVYAEKPLTLCIREGRVLVNAVRKYNRIFQVGSQQRTMAINRIACEAVRTGALGKLIEVQAPQYPGAGPSTLDVGPEIPTPAGFDWNMWLNQCAWRPFNDKMGGGGRDFSGGEMTNWGAHGLDQVQWGTGKDGTGPVEMWPTTEDKDPNGRVEMLYADGTPIHFMLENGRAWGGCIFVCEKGKVEVNRNKVTSNPKDIAVELLKKVNEADEEVKWSDSTALWQAKWHLQNWIECIHSRAMPNADVEIGHRSISVCHLANITRWMGRRLKWDPVKEEFIGDDEANKWVNRPRRAGFELPEQV